MFSLKILDTTFFITIVGIIIEIIICNAASRQGDAWLVQECERADRNIPFITDHPPNLQPLPKIWRISFGNLQKNDSIICEFQ